LSTLAEAALPVCEVISGMQATGVSADGKVIIGSLQAEPRNAVRWTKETGVTGLHAFPPRGMALGVSGDGSVIVGYEAGVDLNGSTAIGRAFRWTAASGLVMLPYLPYGSRSCSATAVSKNGLVAVGYGNGPDPWPYSVGSRPSRAIRWDITGPAQDLGDLDGNPNTFTHSYATACSFGGQIIYGYAQGSGISGGYPGFQWFAAGSSIVNLGLPSGFSSLQVRCCDDSGNMFAGNIAGASSGGAPVACYGTAFVQTRILGDLPGGQYFSDVKAMSGDGLFVGGFGHVAHLDSRFLRQAFVWSPIYEMENLNLLLFSLGMPQFVGTIPQLLLTEVVGISDSTDVIVCNGLQLSNNAAATFRISGLRDFLSGSAPFQINSFYRVAENRVQLAWPCRPGKRYQIQESANLRDWVNVGNPVTGDSFSLLREVNSEGGNARYWRVAVLQD
jgi:uncharacterized membrane protein